MPFVRTAFWAALALSGAALVVGGVASKATTPTAPQERPARNLDARLDAPKALATDKDQTRYDYNGE